MDLFSRKEIRELLNNHYIKPNKGFGQCFLVNKGISRQIIEASDLKNNDIILEIGPGIGNLTLEISKIVKMVIAVEKDKKMCEILKEVLKSQNVRNVKIINEDILKLDSKRLPLKKYKIIANLPFYLTAPAIRKFLEADYSPESMTLIVQKEVAQRICAKPPDMTRSVISGSYRANRGMNLLAVSVQFYAIPKTIKYISKNSFWPSPKVDSAIIKLMTNDKKPKTDTGLFFKIVKTGFSQPRKQLLNNFLKNNLAFVVG